MASLDLVGIYIVDGRRDKTRPLPLWGHIDEAHTLSFYHMSNIELNLRIKVQLAQSS